jgi:myo-inositol-1(or 4)-monophosphatase
MSKDIFYHIGRKEMINKAIMFATIAHENQTRKGTDIPYIMHPIEAAVIVSQIKHDDDLVCAALLHDVAEDSGVSYESISAMFNDRIANLVFYFTEDKSKSWAERKNYTLNNVDNCDDDDIKTVCLGDKLANMRAIARDYKVLGEDLWERFNADKSEQSWYYRGLVHVLRSLSKFPAYYELKMLVIEVFAGGTPEILGERSFKRDDYVPLPLEAIKYLVEVACVEDVSWKTMNSELHLSMLMPVMEGIENNDTGVIEYLDSCGEEVRERYRR